MIFQQLFDQESSTFTYLLASRKGGEALIIDPVLGHVQSYLDLMERLELRLAKAVDTHVHADHITGLGELRDKTRCITVMGEQSPVDVVSMRVKEGDTIDIDGLSLNVLYTPGHTIDSYSFHFSGGIFTGDTLLIRGTGRTDFQSGDPRAQYDSLFNKLLRMPDAMLVYPAHDYKGETVSTIGDERLRNPRLQVSSIEQYVELMNSLNLPNPKMMDVAVPANITIGHRQAETLAPDEAFTVDQARGYLESPGIVWVDLREDKERKKEGFIPGSVRAPYPRLETYIDRNSPMYKELFSGAQRILFYCAFGERSALAVRTAKERGLLNACHLLGGLDAWKKAGQPIIS
jgi:glyoxylase-like metal-dependent hydrolase (beta-lactamase superfamily II)